MEGPITRVSTALQLFILFYSVVTAPAEERIFRSEQHEAFQRDGYLVVRNLLDTDLISRLVKAGDEVVEVEQKASFYYSVLKQGVMFGSRSLVSATTTNIDDNDSDDKTATQQQLPLHHSKQKEEQQLLQRHHDNIEAFRQTAVFSQLPAAAAELMQLDPDYQNLRVLRDVFLARGLNESNTCGWHVDDTGFWPESYQSEASAKSGKDQFGINVWIALDDMPAKYQGGMAVAPGSHKVDWRHEAYLAIGQNRSEDGGITKEDLVRKIKEKTDKRYPTCSLDYYLPAIYQQMEDSQKIVDLHRGDIIFATRLLWHKTNAVTQDGIPYYLSQGTEFLKRYSIRYVPGTARLPNGWSVEWSVLTSPSNAGRSLNDIVDNIGPVFYPQVWPELEDNLQKSLDEVAEKTQHLITKAEEEFHRTFFESSSSA